MNLDDLKALGGIIAERPVKQPITWKRVNEEGVEETLTADVFVVEMSYGDYDSLYMPRAENEDRRRSLQAQMISICIRLGENADERLTYDMAHRLHPNLGAAMMTAVNKVMGKLEKKPKRDGRTLARAGAERSRGSDDRGSETGDDAAGVPAVGGVLPPPGNPEPDAEDGVGLRDAGSDG